MALLSISVEAGGRNLNKRNSKSWLLWRFFGDSSKKGGKAKSKQHESPTVFVIMAPHFHELNRSEILQLAGVFVAKLSHEIATASALLSFHVKLWFEEFWNSHTHTHTLIEVETKTDSGGNTFYAIQRTSLDWWKRHTPFGPISVSSHESNHRWLLQSASYEFSK